MFDIQFIEHKTIYKQEFFKYVQIIMVFILPLDNQCKQRRDKD